MTEIVNDLRDAIAARMKELDLSPGELAKQAGVSMPGLAHLRRGERRAYQVRLTAPVCRALGWTTDSIERLLTGLPPSLLEPVSPPTGVVDDELAELRARMQALEDLWEVVLRRAVAAGVADRDDLAADAERLARQAEREGRGI